jgi:ABC-2 type transport system permease protein
MTDLVAAEWLKLRTTNLLLGLIPAVVAIASAAVAGAVLSADSVAELESAEGVQRVLAVTGTGAILVIVAGVLISAGEYRHGTAADTFLTTPRRHQVLAAKLAVGGCVGLGAGALSALACVAIATIFYGADGATFPFGDIDVWLTLAGTLVYAALFAVLGVAIGSLVRNQVLAVGGVLAWFAVVEHTVVNLAPGIGRWLPAAAGQAIVRTPLDGLLSPAAGAAVMLAYAAAITLSAIGVAGRRDV